MTLPIPPNYEIWEFKGQEYYFWIDPDYPTSKGPSSAGIQVTMPKIKKSHKKRHIKKLTQKAVIKTITSASAPT